MKRKGWIMVLLGVGIAILVTGGLVIAAGTGSKGCATDNMRGKAAGDARMANLSGAGTENGTCDGDCATCENQECVKNQGADSALGNAFNNAEGTCDGSGNASGNGTCDGTGNGTCDGTGTGQQNRNGQQSANCPMQQK